MIDDWLLIVILLIHICIQRLPMYDKICADSEFLSLGLAACSSCDIPGISFCFRCSRSFDGALRLHLSSLLFCRVRRTCVHRHRRLQRHRTKYTQSQKDTETQNNSVIGFNIVVCWRGPCVFLYVGNLYFSRRTWVRCRCVFWMSLGRTNGNDNLNTW